MDSPRTNALSHKQTEEIIQVIKAAGYTKPALIADTLQGGIWRSVQEKTEKKVAIKGTNIDLHKNGSAKLKNGTSCLVAENMLSEMSILKHLSADSRCPAGIVQYVDSFQSDTFYFLAMEDGGHSLLALVRRAHQLIKMKTLQITEWQRVCRVMYQQMVESVAYLHSHNVCHFDLSIENFLINDSNISVVPTPDGQVIKFHIDETDLDGAGASTLKPIGIQTKLCDFGLAERFGITDDNTQSVFMSTKYCGKPHYMSPEVASQDGLGCFNAKSNDVWCLGVCLYVMCIGTYPWTHATLNDRFFVDAMNGNLLFALRKWNKLHYITPEIYEILEACFQFEKYRISVEELAKCQWLL